MRLFILVMRTSTQYTISQFFMLIYFIRNSQPFIFFGVFFWHFFLHWMFSFGFVRLQIGWKTTLTNHISNVHTRWQLMAKLIWTRDRMIYHYGWMIFMIACVAKHLCGSFLFINFFVKKKKIFFFVSKFMNCLFEECRLLNSSKIHSISLVNIL